MAEKMSSAEEVVWSQFLSEYPCGMLRCTCEEYPQVLAVNETMLGFLGLTRESPEWRGFIQRNVFFMLPFEERCAFRSFLDAAASSDCAVEIEHRVYSTAGGFVRLTGWVRMAVDPNGKKEYHFLYLRFSDMRFTPEQHREQVYQKLLQGTYELMFKIDRSDNTITCIHRGKQSKYKGLTGVRIILNDLVRQGIFQQIHKKDREPMMKFFQQLLSENQGQERWNVSAVHFRAVSGPVGREYEMMCAQLDDKTILMCVKDITGERRAAAGEEESEELDIRERLKNADGNSPARILSFHIKGERVYPDSSCRAMNYYSQMSEDDYDRIRTDGMRLSEWMDQYQIPRHAYEQAVQEGEVTLSDDGKNWARRMYLSAEEGQNEELLYTILLLYIAERVPQIREKTKPRVSIRTFGYFDVLVDDKPVIFRYEKSKEMLAVLVDRKGSFVANPYFISCLWENEPYSEKIQGRCRQTAYRLMETLKQYGIENIIEKVDGRRRIVPEMVDCDYFNYIKGSAAPGQLFNGAYMSDYSWGEATLSGLGSKE